MNVPTLSDEVIDRLARPAVRTPSAQSTIDIWYQGGAIAHIGEEEAAFASRSAPHLLGIEGKWEQDS
jgi:hypothetical protein